MKKALLLLMMLILSVVSVSALDITVNDYDPKPAEAGKYLNVWFKVSNQGSNPVSGAQIRVVPKDGLRLSPGESATKDLTTIKARSYDTVQYRLQVDDNAIEGQNVIEVFTINDEYERSHDVFIEVTEKDFDEVILDIGTIDSDPTRIKPDDENVKVDVTLLNVGDTTAQNVKAQLMELPEGISFSESYTDLSLVGSIGADSTEMATFYLDVDESVKPGEYSAPMKLTYKYKPEADEDDYLIEEKTIPLRIPIRSVPLYEITKVEFDPPVLGAGMDAVKMKLTIKNVGEEEGESVRVRVYAKTEQPFSFDVTSDFVSPRLGPGEEGQATLEVDIDDNANLQNYHLDLEIKNVVDDDVITYEKKVEVPLELPLPDKSIGYASIFGVLALIVFIWTGAVYVKKRMKPKVAQKPKNHYKGSQLEKLAKKK